MKITNKLTYKGYVMLLSKGKKIIVFKYKPKKNYRRTQGHRQPYTKVEITSIKLASAAKEEKAESKPVEKVAEKAETKATTTTKKATDKAAK